MAARRTTDGRTTRREFLQRATYVAPTVLTLPAALSIASAGSGSGGAAGSGPAGGLGAGGAGGGGDGCAWWEFWCWKPRMLRRLFD